MIKQCPNCQQTRFVDAGREEGFEIFYELCEACEHEVPNTTRSGGQ